MEFIEKRKISNSLKKNQFWNFQNNYQVTRIGTREKKVMTGAVNRIPGRFKIWSVLSLAPSGPAFALGKCFLRRSWEERGEEGGEREERGRREGGELLVRVRTHDVAREWGHGLAWPGSDLASPGPETPGWTPLSRARVKLTDVMRPIFTR